MPWVHRSLCCCSEVPRTSPWRSPAGMRRAGLRVVLAARPSERRSAAAAELKGLGCDVTEVDLDARDHESHAATIELAFAGGDIDVAVIAFGLLGEAEQAWQRS